MKLFNTVRDWFSRNIDDQRDRCDVATVETSGAGQAILSGEHYFRIWLRDLRLVSDRRWFTDLYPAAHSLVELDFANRTEGVANIVGPMQFGDDVNVANLGNAVVVNRLLTPLIPFSGGSVTINTGLVSVPVEGGLGVTLDIITTFAKQVNVPQISKVIEMSEAIAGSIGQLMMLDGPAVQLNYSGGYTAGGGGEWTDSYFVVAGLPEGTLDGRELWVDDYRLKQGDTAETAGPLNDCDYMLFHIERVEDRDDWESFPEIAAPLGAALSAAAALDADTAEAHLKLARSAVVASIDLTRVDKIRIMRSLRAQVDEYLSIESVPGATLAAATPSTAVSDAQRLRTMVGNTPRSAAIAANVEDWEAKMLFGDSSAS